VLGTHNRTGAGQNPPRSRPLGFRQPGKLRPSRFRTFRSRRPALLWRYRPPSAVDFRQPRPVFRPARIPKYLLTGQTGNFGDSGRVRSCAKVTQRGQVGDKRPKP
jgi:hypothetical protein